MPSNSIRQLVFCLLNQGYTKERIIEYIRNHNITYNNPTPLARRISSLISYFNRHLISCSSCNNRILRYSDIRYFPREGSKRYCRMCFSRLFFQCNGCRVYFPRSLAQRVYGFHYCPSCIEERFRRCHQCNEVFFNDDLRELSHGHLYCSDCLEDNTLLHSYSYRPTPLEFNKIAWENTTFYGIELEVENEYGDDKEENASNTSEYLKDLKIDNKFYLKDDGSLNETGFEIVSHPFTLQYAHKNLKFYKLFKWLKNNSFTSYQTGNCGFHVHIDRKSLTKLEQTKLRAFFSINANCLSILSNRKDYNNSYTQYEYFSRSNILHMKRQEGRYNALNFNTIDDSTIEVRIFRGTLKYTKFLANLTLVDAIVNYIKVIGISHSLSEASWYTFKKYVAKESRYNKVSQLIKENCL